MYDPSASAYKDVLESTPCSSLWEESSFGCLSDVICCMGMRAAPWKQRATAIARLNDEFVQPLTVKDARLVPKHAAAVEAPMGNKKWLRQVLNSRLKKK